MTVRFGRYFGLTFLASAMVQAVAVFALESLVLQMFGTYVTFWLASLAHDADAEHQLEQLLERIP